MRSEGVTWSDLAERMSTSFVYDRHLYGICSPLSYNPHFSCLSGAFHRTGCFRITSRAFLDRSICVRMSIGISIPHGVDVSNSIVSLEFVSIDSTSPGSVSLHSVSPDSMSLSFVKVIGICETGLRVTRSCVPGLRVRYDMM